MGNSKVQSVSNYNSRKVALIRNGMDSFEIIINKVTGFTEIWKAQFKQMELGFEKEIYPKMIFKGSTEILKSKYPNPIEMIDNYVLLGRI